MEESKLQTQIPEQETQASVRGLSHLPAGLHIGYMSDVGRKRERNEDSLHITHSCLRHDLGLESFGLFIVADGMGGHQKGEIASSLAVKVAAASILQDIYLPYLSDDKNANNCPINEALQLAIERANTAVIHSVPDGGTTIVVALVMGNNAYIAHVGDSRAYIFKQHVLKQITEDHSLAQKLEQMGQSAAEARQAQSVLYRAVGQGEAIEVDTHIQHLPAGASLLLCSDGLWDLVDDAAITAVLTASPSPQIACEQLVAAANENGGRDNITAVVVSMGIAT